MAALTQPPKTPAGDEKKEELPAFTNLTDVACSQFGGRVLFATDDWFAECENMISPSAPVFIPDKFTDCGKWMDGWETRRKRIPGHDWCILRLGLPAIIRGVEVSTAFFTGNNTPKFSLQAAYIAPGDKAEAALARTRGRGSHMGTAASEMQAEAAAALGSGEWAELVPRSKLGSGYAETHRNFFAVPGGAAGGRPVTHVRLNMFPDGGIARIRLYGEVRRDWAAVPRTETVDLAAATNGGRIAAFNNDHYGKISNLIAPNRGINMGDGWETRRKLSRPEVLKAKADGTLQLPEFDWAIVRLGHSGYVQEVEVDTNHFKGNFPESCAIDGCYAPDAADDAFASGAARGVEWTTVLRRSKLAAHCQQRFTVNLRRPVTHLRVRMFPDGGISRLRVYGTLGAPARL